MSKEIGPRERMLREQREARFDANREKPKPVSIKSLVKAVATAAKKRGKPRKKK
jgi:hypothetical protein